MVALSPLKVDDPLVRSQAPRPIAVVMADVLRRYGLDQCPRRDAVYSIGPPVHEPSYRGLAVAGA